MKIRYTKHAIERIRKRGITKSEIREAILSGQQRRFQLDGGTIKCVYTKSQRKLTVIYKQDKELYTIITAYPIN